jgi:protease-4
MYDDQFKTKMNQQVGLGADDKANFVTFSQYSKATDFRQSGSDRIAIIYANGDIAGGSESNEGIGSDAYRSLIRKLRLDKSIKAIVLRVNSPGGSALASDVIWREISLTRKSKPVIVSMGDVAASGGYYIACNADSVFANENTITGSIGVFSIVPNLEKFFQNKLGVGFDRVKTAPFADMGAIDRSLTEPEKKFFQASVDSIYYTFKSRVAEGRKMSVVSVDSIAQGRVWTGKRAIGVGLTDRIGTLQDAVLCAAKMSKINSYSVREYPEKKTLLEELTEGYKKSVRSSVVKQELNADAVYWIEQWKGIQGMVGSPQMKMPFTFQVR